MCSTLICRVNPSITVTLKKAEAVTLMKRQPRVVFFCYSEYFDPEQCVSEKKFTVNPNEEHVLQVVNLRRIPATILDNSESLPKNEQHRGHLIGYSISLKQQDMTLTVEDDTKLSLLLNSGFFNVVPCFLTPAQDVVLSCQKKNYQPS
jgi:hypothetical protein